MLIQLPQLRREEQSCMWSAHCTLMVLRLAYPPGQGFNPSTQLFFFNCSNCIFYMWILFLLPGWNLQDLCIVGTS